MLTKLCFIVLTQTSLFNINASTTVMINAGQIRFFENGRVYLTHGGQAETFIKVRENGTQIKEIIDRECK
jgi:hypothetical protein